MPDGSSLVNLGELSKPATVLVEKISDAIGGYFRPYQIRRIARAQADAETIHAVTQLEVSELQRRALQRFIAEEAKKQDNIESIASQALPQVDDAAQPENVEDDWITNFFDRARLISDEEMQRLWARVLAGEANSPGRFSKRSINYMASLDKDDAMLFQTLLGFGWYFDRVFPLVYDVQHEIYTKHGIHFGSLTHLDEIGLVSFNNLTGFDRIRLPKRFQVHYYDMPLDMEGENDNDNTLGLGHVMLSRVGQQLAPIVEAKPVDGFVDYVLEQWMKAGWIPSTPLKVSG